MRNILITFDDMHFEKFDDCDDYYDVHTSGYVINNWNSEQTDDMSREELIALRDSAQIDLNTLIDCESCSHHLIMSDGGVWISVQDERSTGRNIYEDHDHRHKPDKLWHELFVDILDEYGCYEDNGLAYYSDYHTIDYAQGIDRQYCVHIDWNISEEESSMINEEINLRRKNIQQMFQ